MPYQTGTATSFADLQTTLETFSVTNGWTLTSGVLSKAGVHVKFESASNYLRFNIGTGDNGSGSLTGAFDFTGAATGEPFWAAGNGFNMLEVRNGQTMEFPITYHLISLANPDNIFLVVNYNIEHCQHLAFGNFEKYGTWTGGQYGSGTAGRVSSSQAGFLEYCRANNADNNGAGAYLFSVHGTDGFGGDRDPLPSSAVRCEEDGQTWRAVAHSYNSNEANYWVRNCACATYSQPFLTTLSTINLQPVMAPPVLTIGKAARKYAVAGIMPHVRYLRVDYYQPGDIITVGAQKWIVFPHTSVTDYHAGWAIKYDGP